MGVEKITRPCIKCGKEIPCYPSTINKKIYCSIECKRLDTHIINRCIECGKEHVAVKSRFITHGIRYHFCCNKCYEKYKNKERQKSINKKTHKCTNCGKTFTAYRNNKTDMKFCSQKCSREYMVVENSPFFKGPAKQSGGYLTMITKEGQKLQHRLIMEQHIGRKLERNEVVHHIDGNRSNNNIENLKLMDKREHDRFHTNERHKRERRFQKSSRTLLDL